MAEQTPRPRDTERVLAEQMPKEQDMQSGGDDQARIRAGTEMSGVDILPIPPALEFPYPGKRAAESLTASRNSSKANTLPPEPADPGGFPWQASTASGPQAGTPTTAGLLQRIAPNPTRPTEPRRYGTERPMPGQRRSMFRIPTRQKQQFDAHDLDSWGEHYSESSDDENDTGHVQHGKQPPPSARLLKRTTTMPYKTQSDALYSGFAVGNDNYKTRGHVSKHDGRLNISLKETANKGYLAKALGASIQHHIIPGLHHQHDREQTISPLRKEDQRPELKRKGTASTLSDLSIEDPIPVPQLNVLIMVIGSRGDIQPFLRLGKILKEDYGHRVRIATHPVFKKFIEEEGKLEFFNVGGDPAELMAFMVKNPGMIPRTETLRSGEIPRRRAQMFEMFQGFWRACINSSDDERDPSNKKLLQSKQPFVADAIIANPPSFAHIHCAERLGCPLHLMFTFPNTPTQAFPHPLTNIRQTNVDAHYTNFMTYPLCEMFQWQGLGDLINDFRTKTLGLDPLNMLWAPGQIYRQKVPYSYMWSPGLVPKPSDWGPEINVTGFVFLDLASTFKPPAPLVNFLEAGEQPIYIGFGSIVVDDPDKFTQLIFEATRKAGVRALVNKGWGGLGGEEDTPDNVFMLDNTPHDWLFPRVRAVVHHGGAGTTAIGMKCGKPTMIVPFFGDQPFWGTRIAAAGAGPEPVPYKQLSADKLAEGIQVLLTKEKQENAKELARRIEAEGDGAVNAVKSFHKQLPRHGNHSIRCNVLQDQPAAWSLKGTDIQLSSLAVHILVQQRKVAWNDLRLVRIYDWTDFDGPGEPLTGVGTSILASLLDIGAGVGKTPFHWAKIIKRKEGRDRKLRELRSQQLVRHADDQDKEYEKQDKDVKPVPQQPTDKKKNPKSPSQQEDNDLLDHGGKHGLESKLPSGNTPGHQTRTEEASRQRSRPTTPASGSLAGIESSGEEENLAEELAEEAGHGLRESGGALVKMPMNLALALARGFHNAPRLYGDETVRTTKRITGFHSGCRAAGTEFVYGVWDGCTGVVRLPYMGAKEDGTVGFVKGVGKGFGGFVLKDLAAVFGVPAYTLKGVHKEFTKSRQPTAFIRHARTVEGVKRYRELTPVQQKEVEKQVADAWDVIQDVHLEIQRTVGKQGLKGRIRVIRYRHFLRDNNLVENVHGMRRALEAWRAGRDWETEFREEKELHRRDVARALKAKRSARRATKNAWRNETANGNVKTEMNGASEPAAGTAYLNGQGNRQDEPLQQDKVSGAGADGKSRRKTLIADESTGTAAVDQASPNRSRDNSGKTLVHHDPGSGLVAPKPVGTLPNGESMGSGIMPRMISA